MSDALGKPEVTEFLILKKRDSCTHNNSAALPFELSQSLFIRGLVIFAYLFAKMSKSSDQIIYKYFFIRFEYFSYTVNVIREPVETFN